MARSRGVGWGGDAFPSFAFTLLKYSTRGRRGKWFESYFFNPIATSNR